MLYPGLRSIWQYLAKLRIIKGRMATREGEFALPLFLSHFRKFRGFDARVQALCLRRLLAGRVNPGMVGHAGERGRAGLGIDLAGMALGEG